MKFTVTMRVEEKIQRATEHTFLMRALNGVGDAMECPCPREVWEAVNIGQVYVLTLAPQS